MCIHYLQLRSPPILPCLQVCMITDNYMTNLMCKVTFIEKGFLFSPLCRRWSRHTQFGLIISGAHTLIMLKD